jgi:glycogen operon protein
MHRFVRLLASRRILRGTDAERYRVSLVDLLRQSKHAWHGVKLNQPDWSASSRALAFGAELPRQGIYLHWILNSYWEPLTFELPQAERVRWRRWIDTANASPYDIVDWREAPLIGTGAYDAGPRSVVVLFADLDESTWVSEKQEEN